MMMVMIMHMVAYFSLPPGKNSSDATVVHLSNVVKHPNGTVVAEWRLSPSLSLGLCCSSHQKGRSLSENDAFPDWS